MKCTGSPRALKQSLIAVTGIIQSVNEFKLYVQQFELSDQCYRSHDTLAGFTRTDGRTDEQTDR